MAVFGFCMLLKQLKNNNSRRAHIGTGRNLSFSQTNIISGFSLMSQTSIANTQNPMRHLDTMTLEIVGILTKCFNQPRSIKDILYEGLHRAIEFNAQIIPHILQYLDMHFRSYFTIDETQFEIKFDLVVHEKLDGSIEEMDNLGELVMLMGKALFLCGKHNLLFDSVVLKNLMESLVDRIENVGLDSLGITGNLNHKTSAIACQFLNTVEALMAYCVWMTKPDNHLLKKLLRLYKLHSEMEEAIKAKVPAKKSSKKSKKPSDTDSTSQQNTQTSQNATVSFQLRSVTFKPVCILDLATLERFLRLIHDDNATFVVPAQSHTIRINRELSRYILKSTILRIKELQHQPDYRHVQHSRRIFQIVSEISEILFQNCLSRLEDLCMSFDPITGQYSVECFNELLLVVDLLYKRKFEEYLRTVLNVKTGTTIENCNKIIEIMQALIEKSLRDESNIDDESNGEKIPPILLESLEILYRYIPGSDEKADMVIIFYFNFVIIY